MDDFIAPQCLEQIQIVHEDDSLLVIDKPSGLLSLSGKNPLNKDSVHFRLVNDYPSATMVHRLDFGTSGLMVVALNKQINAHLTKQFQTRTIEKQYLAILLGHINDEQGIINAPIAKAAFPYQKVCFETGKAAQSHYKVLERLQDVNDIKTSKVLFTPKTGRTHQLRVHSKEIGHPIIGCDLYTLEINGVNSQQLAKRLMLHASQLTFIHPITEKKMYINSTLPTI